MPVFPVTFSVFGHTLYLHQVTEILAFTAAGFFYRYLRKRQGDSFTDNRRLALLIATALGALAGSRLGGVLENPDQFMQRWHELSYWFGNKTVAGGFVGGLFAVEIAKAAVGERRPSGDLYVFPILLGLFIGRIGCFSMGLAENTYGYPTTLPFGIDLGDGQLRHPLMLYELGFLAVLALVLFQLRNWLAQTSGLSFKVLLIAYLLFRFFVEFLKPDPDIILGLTTLQLICMAGLVYYLLYFLTIPLHRA